MFAASTILYKIIVCLSESRGQCDQMLVSGIY